MKKNKKVEETLDLIISQEQLRSNRERMLKSDRKQTRKENIKLCITVALAVVFVIVLLIYDTNMKSRAINGCVENGYEYSYCVEHS